MSDMESFEEQNINNVISYYKAELRRVLEGASVEEVFNASERKQLRSKGILGFSHLSWFITKNAKEIMNK